jgi:hemolysin type calcium-binding protein
MAADEPGGARGLWLLGLLIACAALALVVPKNAAATVSSTSIVNGNLSVVGSDAADELTVRFKEDGKGNFVVQVFDPAGVPDPLPPGCTRKDPNTVVCPANLFIGIDLHSGLGDDSIVLDFPVLPFASVPAGTFATGFATTVDAGEGNDSESDIGPGGSTLIGGPGNDTQMGGGGDDTQIGGPGNDHLSGQAGNDSLIGGAGNDKEKGGSGNDTLSCGGGGDTGVGGAGKDKTKGCEHGKS